jgi:hypothetical protein
VLLLNTILTVGLLLGIARAILERRDQQQISIVPSCGSIPQRQPTPNLTSHQERSSQESETSSRTYLKSTNARTLLHASELEADREEEEMKPRILVAEHDQATRDGIAAILETAEYQCLKVANTV